MLKKISYIVFGIGAIFIGYSIVLLFGGSGSTQGSVGTFFLIILGCIVGLIITTIGLILYIIALKRSQKRFKE